MNGKSLVNMQISVEEVENMEGAVRRGYSGSGVDTELLTLNVPLSVEKLVEESRNFKIVEMEKEEEEEEKVAGCGLNQQQLVSSLGGVDEITKLEELPSSIDEENGSDDIHVRVVKIKIANPSVHVEGYNGPIHVLKSLWKKGNGFSLNLRFDFDSFSDLQNFIDYSTDLSEKVHTLNEPFVRDKYIANLDVTFTNAVIVKKE